MAPHEGAPYAGRACTARREPIMRLELTGRHVTITPAVRKAVEQRLNHLSRMLNDSIHSVQVVITREKFRHHVEITLHARGEHFLHGDATGRSLPLALGAAAEKVEHQAQKLKSKWTEGKRARRSPRNGQVEAVEADAGTRIIRARRYAVKPMSVDEAALEVTDGRGAFIVFRNSTTDTINVLFRRPDGNLGLIEPEA
ncbi:MAG: ribosome-associated translation inhibitor RaiA [Acidimicrobiia bacterium]|nr:ribosome-associated translation inhibitor RaiA [Acidimicrobiia bacterium]